MADRLLADEIGFENHNTARPKRSLDLVKQGPLEVIEIDDQIVAFLAEIYIFQILLLPQNRDGDLCGSLARDFQRHGRDVDRRDLKSPLRQEKSIAPFPARNIQRT